VVLLGVVRVWQRRQRYRLRLLLQLLLSVQH
jgi:hypothetical protein